MTSSSLRTACAVAVLCALGACSKKTEVDTSMPASSPSSSTAVLEPASAPMTSASDAASAPSMAASDASMPSAMSPASGASSPP